MKVRALAAVLSLLAAGAAAAQPAVPGAGLAAEGASRWREALEIYLAVLEREPGRADLWVRVADIHARLGGRDAALRALTRAVAASPREAALHARLASALADAGRARPALDAIERAAALAPTPDHLRQRAVLAAWAGDGDRARESYARLVALDPDDPGARLGLARACAWSGDTDAAVAEYRRYLASHAEDRAVWLELARAESWRGNFQAASRALDEHRARFGATAEASRERAAILARAGRPNEAMRLARRLLAERPDDYELTLATAIALAAQDRRREALASLETLERLGVRDAETRDARALIRNAVGSAIEPRAWAYADSDGLRIQRFEPALRLALGGRGFVAAGYERAELRARTGSGLDRIGGGRDARHEAAWAGLGWRLGAAGVDGRAGRAWHDHGNRWVYRAAARLSRDRLQVGASRETGYLAVSPRTIHLGLGRVEHRVRVEWGPSLVWQISLEASHEDLSDGNRRWDLVLAPRRAVARTQRLNLDVGLRVRRFGAARDLEHGYYDPARHESYWLTIDPYWKVSEDTGVSASLMAGAQRDDRSPAFGPGGMAAVQATFGIYRDWMLALDASCTLNDRLESGAFRGYRGGAALVRRF